MIALLLSLWFNMLLVFGTDIALDVQVEQTRRPMQERKQAWQVRHKHTEVHHANDHQNN